MKTKKIISAVLALTLCFGSTALPGTFTRHSADSGLSLVQAAEIKDAKCGDHLTCSLSADNTTLIFSGYGDMYKFDNGSQEPWLYSRDITTVIFPEGITSISGASFHSLDKIANIYTGTPNNKKVGFPKSLKSIGAWAFYGCQSLKSVTFLGAVDTIHSSAFGNCQNLSRMNTNGEINEISYEQFENIKYFNNKPMYTCSDNGIPVMNTEIQSILEKNHQSFENNKYLAEYADIYSRYIVKDATDNKYISMSKAQLVTAVLYWIRHNGFRCEENEAPEYITLATKMGCCMADTRLINHILLISGEMIKAQNPDASNIYTPDDILNIECWVGQTDTQRTNHIFNLVNISPDSNPIWLCADSMGWCYFNNHVMDISTNLKVSNEIKYYADDKIGPYANYQFPDSIPQRAVFGDVNEDGVLDENDAKMVMAENGKAQFGHGTFTERQKVLADVDMNGKIETMDATLILKYIEYKKTNDGYDNFWYDNSVFVK